LFGGSQIVPHRLFQLGSPGDQDQQEMIVFNRGRDGSLQPGMLIPGIKESLIAFGSASVTVTMPRKITSGTKQLE
jgi:hypothetical protein